MSKLPITGSLVFLHSVLFVPVAAANWFTGQDLYTVAHQRLLEGNTAASFDGMVQAWQQSPNLDQRDNLDDLFKLAITEDCGRSLEQRALPGWLASLSIQREAVQNQNQLMLKLSITGVTRINITGIQFSKWPDLNIISTNPKVGEGGYFAVETRRLKKPVNEGLYKLTITAEGKESFNRWILLTKPESKRRISWLDKKNWRIEQRGLSNPTCPSQVLSMSVYDLNDTSWTPLWTDDVAGKLPTSLPKIDVPDGRYWLSVGLVDSRWQGEISVLDIQKITRPVDFPDF